MLGIEVTPKYESVTLGKSNERVQVCLYERFTRTSIYSSYDCFEAPQLYHDRCDLHSIEKGGIHLLRLGYDRRSSFSLGLRRRVGFPTRPCLRRHLLQGIEIITCLILGLSLH